MYYAPGRRIACWEPTCMLWSTVGEARLKLGDGPREPAFKFSNLNTNLPRMCVYITIILPFTTETDQNKLIQRKTLHAQFTTWLVWDSSKGLRCCSLTILTVQLGTTKRLIGRSTITATTLLMKTRWGWLRGLNTGEKWEFFNSRFRNHVIKIQNEGGLKTCREMYLHYGRVLRWHRWL